MTLPTSPVPAARRRRMLCLWLASSLTPLLLYFLARPYVRSDTTALAISAAAPAVVIVIAAAWRRRVRVLGVLTVVGLGAALAATAMTGGSSLPLKLYRPLFTGVVGLALLLSVAVRRPLLVPVVRALAGRLPPITPPRRTATVVTAIIGASFLVEAAATVLLALTVSTGEFLVASRLTRIAVFAAGFAVAAWYLRRQRGRREPADAERRAWFGPRRFGLGWRPQTWQARVIMVAVVALLVVARVVFHLPGR